MAATDLCGFTGCKHSRRDHQFGACGVRVERYNEVLYGYRQPVIYKSCGCTWVEPVALVPQRVRDNPQS